MSKTPYGIFALIHDLQCPNPDDMLIPELAERVRYLKCTEEGNKEVSDYINKYINEEVKAVVSRIVVKLAALGKLSIEEIADCVEFSPSEVQNILDNQTHTP